MKGILIDVDRCSGCRQCEMVCSFYHEKAFSSSTSRISLFKEDRFGFDLPIVCWHCSQCDALESCSEEALERSEEGLIVVNSKKCTGCGKCLEACIIGAIKLHPERGTPLICDRCGGKPLCVENCPTKALVYTETEMRQARLVNQVLLETLKRWRIVV